MKGEEGSLFEEQERRNIWISSVSSNQHFGYWFSTAIGIGWLCGRKQSTDAETVGQNSETHLLMEMQRYCFSNLRKNIYLHLLCVPLLLTHHPPWTTRLLAPSTPTVFFRMGVLNVPIEPKCPWRDRYYSIKRSVSAINHSNWWLLIRGQIGHFHQRRNLLPPPVVCRFTSWPHLSCGSSCRPKCLWVHFETPAILQQPCLEIIWCGWVFLGHFDSLRGRVVGIPWEPENKKGIFQPQVRYPS